MIAAKQCDGPSLSGSYNIGPTDEGCVNNETLVELFAKHWGSDFKYEIHHNPDEPHEANYLKLDCSKVRHTFGWVPQWDISEAVFRTVEWTKAYLNGNPVECMDAQIEEYMNNLKW